LDVVVTRDDLPVPTVDVIDVGLSDHRLLYWSMSVVRLPPVYTTSVHRPWRKVNVDKLCEAILALRLCCSDTLLNAASVDDLAELYSAELFAIADRLAPERSVTVHHRASDP